MKPAVEVLFVTLVLCLLPPAAAAIRALPDFIAGG
jgi:hypothetical protein